MKCKTIIQILNQILNHNIFAVYFDLIVISHKLHLFVKDLYIQLNIFKSLNFSLDLNPSFGLYFYQHSDILTNISSL